MQRPFVSEIEYVEGAALVPVAGVLTVTDEVHAVNTDGTPGYTTITTITKATPRVGQRLRLHRGPAAATPILFQPITGNLRSQTEQGVWIAQAGDEVELVCTAVAPAVLWTVARVTSLTIAPVDTAIVGGAAAVGLSSRVGLVPETNPDDLDTLNGGVAGQVVTLQLSAGALTPVRITQAGNIRCSYAQDLWLSNASDYVRLLFDTATGWSVLDYKAASEFQTVTNTATPGIGTGTLNARDGRLQVVGALGGALTQWLFNILNGAEGEELFVRIDGVVTTLLVVQAGGNIRLPMGQDVSLNNAANVLRFQFGQGTWALMEVLKVADYPVPVDTATPGIGTGTLDAQDGRLQVVGVAGALTQWLFNILNGAEGEELFVRIDGVVTTLLVVQAGGNIRLPMGQDVSLNNAANVLRFQFGQGTWALMEVLKVADYPVPVDTATPGLGTGTLDAQDGRLQVVGVAGAAVQWLFNILQGGAPGGAEGEELFVRIDGVVTTSLVVQVGGNIRLPLGRNLVLDNATDMLRFQYHGATWALMEVLKAAEAPVAEVVAANAITYLTGGSILVTFGGAALNTVTGPSANGAKLRLTFADAGTIAVVGGANSIVTPDGLPLRVRAGDEVELFYNAATTFWTLTAYMIALPISGLAAGGAANPSSGRQLYVAFQRLNAASFAGLMGLQADINIYGALPNGAEVLDIVVDNGAIFVGGAPPNGLATLNCQVGQVGALAGVRGVVDVAAAAPPAVPRRLYGVRGVGLDFAAAQVPNAHFTAVATGTGFLNLQQITAGQVDFYVLFVVLPRVP